MNSKAISQSDTTLVFLDSATAVRVINDLEKGDRCLEREQLYEEEIKVLKDIIKNDSSIISNQDTVIVSLKEIKSKLESKGENYEKIIDAEKRERKRIRRQRNLIGIGAVAEVVIIILILI